MSSISNYKGITAISPISSGASIIMDDFKELADRVGPVTEGSVAPAASDDSNSGLYQYSKWLNTGADPYELFMCTDPTPDAAKWVKIGPLSQGDLTDVHAVSGTTSDGAYHTLLNSDGESIELKADETYTFFGLVTGRRTDQPGHAGYKIEGVCYNESGTGSLSGCNITPIYEESSSWHVECTIEGASGSPSLSIRARGDAGATVDWAATIQMTQS